MIKINENNKGIYYIYGHDKEIANYINKNNVSTIIFDEDYLNGAKDIDISFLLETKSIENIKIADYKINIDLEVVYKLEIKKLFCLYPLELAIDFSRLNYIEEVDLHYNKKMNFKGLSNSFKKLTLRKFKQKNLEDCFDENNIMDLWIAQSDLISLKGLSNFSNIEKIRIALSSKLIDISDLKHISNSLKQFELDSCKLLSDFSVLEELTKIEEISMYNVGHVSTTSYFKNLSQLKTLFLRGNTKVLNQNKQDVSHINKVVIADMDLMIGCQ